MRALTVDIVGGGIGGITAALCLAKVGAEVTVHEQAAARAEVGAGLQIGPNGMQVLDRLGLQQQILSNANRPDQGILRDGLTGRPVARVRMGDRALRRYGQPYVQMHRADLLSVLGDAAESAGVSFRYGSTVDPGNSEAAVVVGADGVRSATRAMLVPDSGPVFTGSAAWRALVPADRVSTTLSADAHVFMGPGQHLVAYPLRHGSVWNVVAVREQAGWSEEGWSHRDDPDAMRRAFADWCPEVTALLEPVEEVLLWGLFAHPVLPRWQDGRHVLLGDACHPMLPFMAQGATMAIEDAWVLAQCIDDLKNIPEALEQYERLRKPRASRVQAASARNAGIYHMQHGIRRVGLHAGLRVATAVSPDFLTRKLDWLYATDVTQMSSSTQIGT